MKSSKIEVNSMAVVSGATPHFTSKIMAMCTVKVRDMNGDTYTLKLYEQEEGKLKFPRAIINGNIPITPSKYWKEKVGIGFKKDLRDYQKPLVDKILRAYQDGFYGGILHAGTGTGKSIIALKVASEIDARTCIIVPLSRIVEQWERYILEFTDLKESDIGYIWQNRVDIENKKIVIAMLPSLASRLLDYGEELYKSFYLTIWDEGHVLGARTFSQVVPLFHDKFRLMLSATPRRKDGAEHVFKYHIGRVIAKFDRVLLSPQVLKVEFFDLKTRDGGFYYRGKFNRGVYIRSLSAIIRRNKLLVKYIVKAYKKDRNILVLSDRIRQLQTLEKLLSLEGIQCSRCYAKFKDTSKRVILATYNAIGMAVDIPKLDTLIIASPRSDIEQPAGRILREVEGKKNPVIVDIVDIASNKMVGGWKARLKFYRKVGAKIKTVRWKDEH